MMLSDFGGFPPAAAAATRRIADLQSLRQAVTDCVRRRSRIRARCFSHSMNGMSVPAEGETVLDMTGVRHLVWKGEGIVVAGAGLSVWELDQYVRGFGWKLPVINDGSAEAPSLGGFVAAGGIGEGTVFHGGFWETVRGLTLVTGDGEERRLSPQDPLFHWVFGAMGGLGLVYEIEIELVPVDHVPPRPVTPSAALPRGPQAQWPDHLWLTLFVPEARRDEGAERLGALVEAHPKAWIPRGPYEYYLSCQSFNPPLVLGDEHGDFVALGVWGDGLDRRNLDAYSAMEADFQAMVEACGFRRYFQSEMIRRRRPLESYVGAACAERFRALKATLDPLSLLNAFMPQRAAGAARGQVTAHGAARLGDGGTARPLSRAFD